MPKKIRLKTLLGDAALGHQRARSSEIQDSEYKVANRAVKTKLGMGVDDLYEHLKSTVFSDENLSQKFREKEFTSTSRMQGFIEFLSNEDPKFKGTDLSKGNQEAFKLGLFLVLHTIDVEESASEENSVLAYLNDLGRPISPTNILEASIQVTESLLNSDEFVPELEGDELSEAASAASIIAGDEEGPAQNLSTYNTVPNNGYVALPATAETAYGELVVVDPGNGIGQDTPAIPPGATANQYGRLQIVANVADQVYQGADEAFDMSPADMITNSVAAVSSADSDTVEDLMNGESLAFDRMLEAVEKMSQEDE